MPQPLLFPLNRLSQTDVAALQASLRAPKLLQPTFMQQRAINGMLVPRIPANRPWNALGLPSLIDQPTLVPSVVHELRPSPATFFRITGTTKDSSGVALGNCTVRWFDTATNTLLDTTTSDASGAFEFRTAGQPPTTYYLVAYKAGTTDRAGTTVNTLVGT